MSNFMETMQPWHFTTCCQSEYQLDFLLLGENLWLFYWPVHPCWVDENHQWEFRHIWQHCWAEYLCHNGLLTGKNYIDMNTSWYDRQRLGLPKATPGSQLVWRNFTDYFLESKMPCSTLTKEPPPGLVQVSSQTRPPKTLLCLPQSPGQRWSMKITLKGQITLAHQVPSHNWA